MELEARKLIEDLNSTDKQINQAQGITRALGQFQGLLVLADRKSKPQRKDR